MPKLPLNTQYDLLTSYYLHAQQIESKINVHVSMCFGQFWWDVWQIFTWKVHLFLFQDVLEKKKVPLAT